MFSNNDSNHIEAIRIVEKLFNNSIIIVPSIVFAELFMLKASPDRKQKIFALARELATSISEFKVSELNKFFKFVISRNFNLKQTILLFFTQALNTKHNS